jgi:integrative and conjugative element protein (TIGR02256 family)
MRDPALKPYVFKQHRGGVIAISGTALEKMRKYVQRSSRATEAGGVLLGRFLLGSLDVIVDDVTTPMRVDKRTRYSLWRSEKHQQSIDKAWDESEGTCVYLGEWHTHPELVPSYSNVDEANWSMLLSESSIVSPKLFFVIVGIEEICCWQGQRQKATRPIGNFKKLRRV